MALNESVVENSQSVGECRFQSRITDLDVKRVAVIDNRQQVCHAWLCRCSPIVYSEIALLVKTISEIESWTPVDDIPDSIGMYPEIILYVMRPLRLQHHTDIEPVFLSVHAQHELSLMGVCLVLRASAQVVVKIFLKR